MPIIAPVLGFATSAAGSAIIGGAATLGASALQSGASNRAAQQASAAQQQSAQLGIDEQRRQFDEIQALLSPFVQGGTDSLMAQMNLVGLGGDEAYQAAIEQIRTGPEFLAMQEAGEASILANASATGGLRGGNTQSALAQFSQQNLANQIGTQFNRLGGIAGLGQASAAQQAALGQSTASNIGQLYGAQGAAQAGAALAQGQNRSNFLGDVGAVLGSLSGNDAIRGITGDIF